LPPGSLNSWFCELGCFVGGGICLSVRNLSASSSELCFAECVKRGEADKLRKRQPMPRMRQSLALPDVREWVNPSLQTPVKAFWNAYPMTGD
jgi:hypothetical protein